MPLAKRDDDEEDVPIRPFGRAKEDEVAELRNFAKHQDLSHIAKPLRDTSLVGEDFMRTTNAF